MPAYRHLYFLYVWNEPCNDATQPALWRYRLEDATTREKHLFSALDKLITFLQEQEQTRGLSTADQQCEGSDTNA
ncbi:MAG: hypothetical protein N2559_12190 [Anaerolineae bacterium]|nr:hypothetical protein [Anaerolineae bacterium]